MRASQKNPQTKQKPKNPGLCAENPQVVVTVAGGERGDWDSKVGGRCVGALDKQSMLVIRTIQGYMLAHGKSTA